MKSIIRKLFKKYGYEITRVTPPLVANNPKFGEPEYILNLEYENLEKQPFKVHLGCGPRVLKNWINIDLVYEPFENYLQYYTDEHYPIEVRGGKQEFYALDVTKVGIPLPNDSVNVVFHEDFIEHLSQRNQIVVLTESLRILKKGGVHRINTPDLFNSMCNHSNFKKGIDGVYVGEWDLHGHLNVLTRDSLKEIALMVGYKEVIFNGRNQSICELIPSEYRPDLKDRPENGNIFADLVK